MPRISSFMLTAVLAMHILALGCGPARAAEPEKPQASSAGNEPQAIVQAADRIRFPGEGFQVDVVVTTTAPGRNEDVREYRILSKGNDNTIVLTTMPASERGQIMLMKDRDLWVFLPRVSQPVRLPLSQKLTGQVANGDLARANFAGDYAAKLLRVDKVDGMDQAVLELTAKERGVTYQKVLYWVNLGNHRPCKAEFYTVSGRLLKTARYEGFAKMEGEIRPTRLILEDALKSQERSVMEYRNMKLRDLPDKVFTKDYMKKIQASGAEAAAGRIAAGDASATAGTGCGG